MHYLVICCCNLDDLPVGLYSLKADADRIAQHVAASNGDCDEVKEIADKMALDASGYVCTKIVSFTGGKPADVTML